MDEEKLLRIKELTHLYISACISQEEKTELAQLQKEWLIEQSPSDINVLRSVS